MPPIPKHLAQAFLRRFLSSCSSCVRTRADPHFRLRSAPVARSAHRVRGEAAPLPPIAAPRRNKPRSTSRCHPCSPSARLSTRAARSWGNPPDNAAASPSRGRDNRARFCTSLPCFVLSIMATWVRLYNARGAACRYLTKSSALHLLL